MSAVAATRPEFSFGYCVPGRIAGVIATDRLLVQLTGESIEIELCFWVFERSNGGCRRNLCGATVSVD